MAKETILTVLEQQLMAELGDDYDFALDFDSCHHCITLYFRLFVQNQNNMAIEDESGVMAEDIIEFEDAIAFQDEKRKLNDDDYLHVFYFNRKKGIPRAYLVALAKTLRHTLDEGQSDLLDFVTDDEDETFELTFDMALYQDEVACAEQRYHDVIEYPKF